VREALVTLLEGSRVRTRAVWGTAGEALAALRAGFDAC
jgi:hypothetical protein